MKRPSKLIGTNYKNAKIIRFKDKVYLASENKPLMEIKNGKLIKLRKR